MFNPPPGVRPCLFLHITAFKCVRTNVHGDIKGLPAHSHVGAGPAAAAAVNSSTLSLVTSLELHNCNNNWICLEEVVLVAEEAAGVEVEGQAAMLGPSCLGPCSSK